MDKQGGRLASRRQALALLLACSALANPGDVRSQTLGPAAAQSGDATLPPAADTANGIFPAEDDRAGLATAAIPAPGFPDDDPPYTPPYAEDLNQPYGDDLNPAAEAIDPGEAPVVPGDPTGIRLGTFMLRPSISQTVNRETIRFGDTRTDRDYLGTNIRGTLSSDWSRHEFTVTGEGTFERDIGDDDEFEPEGRIDANLRLDLADETIANISGGYSFEREDNNDPNAIGGAAVQSGVHRFDGDMTLERNAGIIHSLAGLGVTRESYTDAELQDGSSLSFDDRDRTIVDGRLRLGYELSPALIPFMEVSGGRAFYDETRDFNGYERSSWAYAARTGVEFDLGEKLNGELSAGYARVDYDDTRLEALQALTLDGRLNWSPQRGTDVELALLTTLRDSIAPGESGWAEYDATATVTHQLRHRLVGRLTGGAILRDFPQDGHETTWIAGTGLTWSLNPYLDLTGNVEYEWTDRSSGDTDIWRAGMGLTLRK
jgi:hypothetical protein